MSLNSAVLHSVALVLLCSCTSGPPDGGTSIGTDSGETSDAAILCGQACGTDALCSVSDDALAVATDCVASDATESTFSRFDSVAIEGDLRLGGLGGEEVEFATVHSIGNSLRLDGPFDGSAFLFPGLETVGASLALNADTGVTQVSAPELRSVGYSIDVEAAEDLTELVLPLLEEIGADLSINGNPVLTHLQLDSLQRVGGDLSVVSNATLAQCSVEMMLAGVDVSGQSVIELNSIDVCD